MRGSEVVKHTATSAQFGPVSSPISSRISLAPSSGGSIAGRAFASSTPFLVSAPAVSLSLRSDLHLARKAWHLIMGSTIALIYASGMSVRTSLTILGSVLVWDLLMEGFRLKIPSFNHKLMRVWRPFMRACEVNRLSGVPYYLAATILAIAIFPKPVAILSILFLAFGDPIASLFGILYGDKSVRFSNGKSLIGTLAGSLTCALVSFVFLSASPISGVSLGVLTVAGGLAGGMAELVPLDMDDNFTIPVVSGFVLWLTFIVLGI